MRKLLQLLLLPFLGYGQYLTFQDLTPLPEDYLSLLTTSTDGQNIIINCGDSPQDYIFLYKYSTENDSWNTITTNPSLEKLIYANGEIINNNLYRFNGRNGNGELEIIDLDSGDVSYGSNNPNPVSQGGSAVNGNNIYVFGGNLNGEYSNKFYYYNIIFDSWTELPNMPEAKNTRGEFINKKLYVIGGYNGNVSNKIDVYNTETNSWENQYVMPFAVSAHSTAVFDNKIYIISDYSEMTRIVIFDTTNISYTNVETNNMKPRRHSDSEIINDKLYLICGNNTSSASGGGWLNNIQSADLSSLLSLSKIDNTSITIYPNPTTSILTIDGNKEYQIKVYDLLGNKVLETQGNSINMAHLSTATYIVKATDKSNNEELTYKVVKN
ncbi:MAG: N-acetylneuraminate epimerase [Bacteroidota bacterium]|nr:MAG: N-acetylneuraminate epimerase [Bacteroidota bacterium]